VLPLNDVDESLDMDAPLIPDPAYYPSSQPIGPAAHKAILGNSDPCAGQTAMHLSGCVSGWAMSRRRRAIDFLCALVGFICFAPLMVLIGLAVKLSSRGPALFKQERMGRDGQVFVLYKFRSMQVAASDGSPITVIGDKRITPVGLFLRKFKLDELPQFWNVLRGDMSLIGPRPKLPHHEALHMPFRPGITGAATLAFRYEEEMLRDIPPQHLDAYYERYVKPRKAEIDWNYMRTATLRSDLRLIWLTAKACISDKESELQVTLPVFSIEGAD
jgi:lipopolysaccharide/colanic/teichoic acid biosynthesis glycosyltransferase